MTKQPPMFLTIPTPMYSPQLRGVQAARGPYALGPLGYNMRIRFSKVDGDRIDAVCQDLGLKKTEYIRWCAVEVARALHGKRLKLVEVDEDNED